MSASRLTIDGLRAAIEGRDAATLIGFYSPDAVLQIIDRDHPPSRPTELVGQAAIGEYLAETCGRDMTHRVEDGVTEGDRIAFSQLAPTRPASAWPARQCCSWPTAALRGRRCSSCGTGEAPRHDDRALADRRSFRAQAGRHRTPSDLGARHRPPGRTTRRAAAYWLHRRPGSYGRARMAGGDTCRTRARLGEASHPGGASAMGKGAGALRCFGNSPLDDLARPIVSISSAALCCWRSATTAPR